MSITPSPEAKLPTDDHFILDKEATEESTHNGVRILRRCLLTRDDAPDFSRFVFSRIEITRDHTDQQIADALVLEVHEGRRPVLAFSSELEERVRAIAFGENHSRNNRCGCRSKFSFESDSHPLPLIKELPAELPQ